MSIKKIVFPLLSLFLIYQTYGLTYLILKSEPEDFNQLLAVLISFLLTLFVTGIFAFVGFAYPSGNLLPNSYYDVKRPKRVEFVYRLLGIQYFRILLLFTFWGTKSNRKKYFNGTKKGLNNFIYQTRQSEFGHLAAFVVILVLSIVLLGFGYVFMALITTAINVIGNLYPIILQRAHRARIQRVVKQNRE